MRILGGLAVVVLALALVRHLARGGGAYRLGPWPGLSPRGAAVLLANALLLAGGELLLGAPGQAFPDLPLLAIVSLVPVALATVLVQAPGTASAVCGAYLLPRSLLSLASPGVPLPPPLVVPALAFDVIGWLRPSDLAALRNAWPGRRNVWRVRDRRPRALGPWRTGLAGAAFGASLAALEPAFVLLLGADPTRWSISDVVVGAGLSSLAGAVLGRLAVSRIVVQLLAGV